MKLEKLTKEEKRFFAGKVLTEAWKDESAEDVFADAGFYKFDDFWDLEGGQKDFEYRDIRKHRDRKTGEVNRQICCLKIRGVKYFLKRSSGRAFINLVNEREGMKAVEKFGLRSSKLLYRGFDPVKKRSVLLTGNLGGFYPLSDLLKYKVSPEIAADFEVNKIEFLQRLTRAIKKMHKKKYFYPDWFAKHIYVRPKPMEIALIDLERFRHISNCPWIYHCPLHRIYVIRKEWKTLKKSLGSTLYTRKFLNDLLRDSEKDAGKGR